jgi:alkanesulfonate monooxygenase SsuD/methylene tetrahydromethanopterin reductase-like flavin-dependent oxidoreductase (luciferase family)
MIYLSGTIDDMRDRVNRCIDAGIDHIYFPDHLVGGRPLDDTATEPWLDGWPSMLDIASRHNEITIGPLVANPSLRPAAELASLASTTAHIVGSHRFLLTVGGGNAQSDLYHTGELEKDFDSYERFSSYVDTLMNYLTHQAQPDLRLPSDVNIRLACDSVKTAHVVAQHAHAWVSTGGWKTTLDKRIARVNSVWAKLQELEYQGTVAFFADSVDGLKMNSSQDDLRSYAQQFEAPIDELVISITS